MAINFLNTVDFNKNQLDYAAIQNIGANPAGTAVEGQIYFNTSVFALMIYANGAWVEVGATSGVETLTTTKTGNSIGNPLTVLSSATGNVTINSFAYAGGSNIGYVPAGGTVGKYLDGAGNWLDVTTGDITEVQGNTYINVTNQTGPIPIINHDLTTRTDTSSTLSPGSTGTFTSVDSVTTNTTGHITALNLKTVTMPTSDNYISWTLDGDSGTPQTISSGNTATFVGNTKITTLVGATDTLTITHDSQSQTNTTSSASPAHGATFTVIDAVTVDSTGHVGGRNLKTITLPTDNDTTYTLPVSAGTAVSGFTVADIDLTASPGGIASKVTFAGKNSNISITETTGNNGVVKIALTNDVTIANDLTVTADLAVLGTGAFTGQATVPLVPTLLASATSKQYVDQSNIGQSIFQGGYNAATNTPDLDVSPSTAIKKGWFWAVTDTGDFFSEEVQPGDLIYANQDNPGATYANWTVVQSGQDIAAAGASDGATVKGIAGFNSAHFNVTSNGWVSSDIYGGGSTLGIVPSGGTSTSFLRGDGTFAVPAYITYSAMNTTTLGLGRLRYAIGATPAANSQSTTAGRTYGITKNGSDQLIVNVPWTVVSVAASTANNLLGISVTPTTGDTKVGLDINGLAAISALADADTLPIYDGGINKKISLLQLENHIGAAKAKRFILNTTTTNVSQQTSPPGGTIGWVVAAGPALGVTSALDCAVEIIQTSNGATVYAEITRSGTNVTINFSTPVSQGAYQAIVTRIY